MDSVVFGVLPVILAIVATVLAFVFIVPDKKREKLNKFWKFVHDTVNFKYLIIEKILQAMYIFATSATILTGFFMLFYVEKGYSYGYYYRSPTWYGGYGLLVMILGPIVIRILYELGMMLVLLVKNVIQINNKMKAEGANAKDVFAVPGKETYAEEPAAPAVPEKGFCTNCGAKLAEGANFCTSCGTKN